MKTIQNTLDVVTPSSAYQTSFHGTWYLPSEQADDASGKEAYQEMVLTLRLWWLFNFPEVESRVVLTHDCREGLWISKSYICLQCCYFVVGGARFLFTVSVMVRSQQLPRWNRVALRLQKSTVRVFINPIVCNKLLAVGLNI